MVNLAYAVLLYATEQTNLVEAELSLSCCQ